MTNEKTGRIIGIAAFAAAVVLSIVGWFLLPEEVVVQVGMNGLPSRVMPKAGALLPAPLLSGFGMLAYWKTGAGRMLFIAVVGALVGVLLLAFNL